MNEHTIDGEDEPLLPLDERFRHAEQYAFDLPDPPARVQAPALHEEKTCGKAGFCYCPKCNPR